MHPLSTACLFLLGTRSLKRDSKETVASVMLPPSALVFFNHAFSIEKTSENIKEKQSFLMNTMIYTNHLPIYGGWVSEPDLSTLSTSFLEVSLFFAPNYEEPCCHWLSLRHLFWRWLDHLLPPINSDQPIKNLTTCPLHQVLTDWDHSNIWRRRDTKFQL